MPANQAGFSSDSNWTVPHSVDKVRLLIKGAAGGNSDDASGGNGGIVEGDTSVSEDDTIYLKVGMGDGGNGPYASTSEAGHSASANAGDGGESTEARLNSDDTGSRLIVAGGGGGAGDTGEGGEINVGRSTGNGGGGGGGAADGQDASTSNTNAAGGAGGGGNDASGDSYAAWGESSDGHYLYAGAGGGGGGGVTRGDGGTYDAYGVDSDPQMSGSGGGGGDGYIDSSVSVNTKTVGGHGGNAYAEIQYADRVTDLTGDTSVDNEITLSWTQPVDANQINIYRAEVSGSSVGDYTQIESGLSETTTSYTDTGLEDGEQYYYRVENVNSFDNRLSNQPSPITNLPEPTDFSHALDGTNVELTWANNDDSSDGDISIERSEDGGSTWSTISSGMSISATSYTDTTRTVGETVHYRVNRNTSDTTATSVVKEVPIAGSLVIASDGLRQTTDGVVHTGG